MAPADGGKRPKRNLPQDLYYGKQLDTEHDSALDDVGERTTSDQKQNKRMSWYMKSWSGKSKAAAVTEVARESISAANTTTSERSISSSSLSIPSRRAKSSSIELTKKIGGSTRSLPADATMTRINIASTGSSSTPKLSNTFTSSAKPGQNVSDETGNQPSEPEKEKEPKHSDKKEQSRDIGNVPRENAEGEEQKSKEDENSSPGWLSWLQLTRNTTDVPLKGEDNATPITEARSTELWSNNSSAERKETKTPDHEQPRDSPNEDDPTPTAVTQQPQRRSWLQMWSGNVSVSDQSNTQDQSSSSQITKETTDLSQAVPPKEATNPQPPTVVSDLTSKATETEPPTKEAPSSSSGWIGWTRERLEPHLQVMSSSQRQSSSGVSPDTPAKEKSTETENLQGASISATDRSNKSLAKEVSSTQEDEASASDAPTEPKLQTMKRPSTPPKKRTQQTLPNELLPLFKHTFPFEGRSGIIQQLGRLISYGKGSELRHVSRVQNPPRIKKALAIGIHGYFPAPLLRSVIGQPTGTSVKFATMAENAIVQWAETNNVKCDVEKIALEGEGRIAERVDLLWKMLLRWIEYIRDADFIMISCHSQGVPVATMLVSKLVSFGCVSYARIGICAMAGVNLGPFPDYRSRWISGSAGELFDFASSKSKVSQDYMTALQTVLDYGVRVTYVGSIDDQLVSLESAIFSSISHPHIYRAVFVDGRVHAPSFLSHLVGFAMKLRNLGISDHGLIRELSSPLAGSLYTGEGHSRLYDDEAVYQLAVEYTLETTTISNAIIEIHKTQTSLTPNPYILPFAMRGVLEEEHVRHQLSEETTELLKQFDEWRPSTKVLKDVKFRLEGIRSKL